MLTSLRGPVFLFCCPNRPENLEEHREHWFRLKQVLWAWGGGVGGAGTCALQDTRVRSERQVCTASILRRVGIGWSAMWCVPYFDIYMYFFGGLECVGHSIAYVALL